MTVRLAKVNRIAVYYAYCAVFVGVGCISLYYCILCKSYANVNCE